MNCPKPGKHPWLEHGYKDATTAEAGIRQWWAFRPDSGVGINLAKSGLVDIAPDSPAWLATFQQRGLPDTSSYQSGGGEGNRHHWYRRPEGCPSERCCVPSQYDVMAEGLTMAPPTLHSSGRTYTWLTDLSVSPSDLPEAPAWAVEMLRERATRNEQASAAAGTLDGDEPPVRLDEAGLRRWRGELVETKLHDEVDKSDSLFEIGRVLAKANASRQTIVDALIERDATLGWNKYSDRRNNREYERIADKAILEAEDLANAPKLVHYAYPKANGVNGHANGTNGHTDGHAEGNGTNGHSSEVPPVACGHEPLLAKQREIITALRAENGELQATIRATLQVFANEHLRGAEKMTAVRTAFLVHERDSHGAPTLPGGQERTKRMYIPKIAAELGQSAATTGRHITTLAATMDSPFIKTTSMQMVEDLDPATGERRGPPRPRTVMDLEPRAKALSETLRTIAAYAPPERATHGGKRIPTCPDHPNAVVSERTAWACTECGSILDERESLHHQDGCVGTQPHTLCQVPNDDQDGGVGDAEPAAAAAEPDLDIQDERVGGIRPAVSCIACRGWLLVDGSCPNGCMAQGAARAPAPPPAAPAAAASWGLL